MTITTDSANGRVHLIERDLSVADARDALAALTDAVGTAPGEGPLALDLSGTNATAPALQLLIAGARALVAAGGFSGFGPSASAALGALSIQIPAEG